MFFPSPISINLLKRNDRTPLGYSLNHASIKKGFCGLYSPESPKRIYNGVASGSIRAIESPFIKARCPNMAGTAQDWDDVFISQPKIPSPRNPKVTCHTHVDVTKLPCA
jgi:hypothetical protein